MADPLTAPCNSWCAGQLMRFHALQAATAPDTAAQHRALGRQAAVGVMFDRLLDQEQPTPPLVERLMDTWWEPAAVEAAWIMAQRSAEG